MEYKMLAFRIHKDVAERFIKNTHSGERTKIIKTAIEWICDKLEANEKESIFLIRNEKLDELANIKRHSNG